MTWQALNKQLLRGGLCAVWLSAFIMSAFEFVFSIAGEDPAPYVLRSAACLVIGIVACCMHSYLVKDATNG